MEEITKQVSKLNHDVRNSLSVVYSTAQLLELMLEQTKNADVKSTAKQLVQSIQDTEQLLAREVTALKELLKNT